MHLGHCYLSHFPVFPFFFSSFQFSPHTHWFRHSQGERWVWSRRGESFAHRPACRGRYLLWELQDNPGLEICKCNLAGLMWGCTNCIQCEQRMNREAALLAQPNFIWTSSSSLPRRVGVATEIRKSKNNSNLPAPLKKKNKKPNKQKQKKPSPTSTQHHKPKSQNSGASLTT